MSKSTDSKDRVAEKSNEYFMHLTPTSSTLIDELLEVIKQDTTSKQILVFCMSSSSCNATEHFLTENGLVTAALHGEIPPMVSARNYPRYICCCECIHYCTLTPLLWYCCPQRRKEQWEKFKSGEARILVCSDIASRGLDIESVSKRMFSFFLYSL
jgi:superfamily II DNA/RNA helicase